MRKRIELSDDLLLSAEHARLHVANQLGLFIERWIVLDRILFTNDYFIERIRNNEITANAHILNGDLIDQEQADSLHPKVGEFHRQMEKRAKENWENQFQTAQNWIRVSSLAQAYLIWEEQIRGRFLELVNFEHESIDIDKSKARLEANTFGDLRHIRHSLWHADTGGDELGVCLFEVNKLKEITKFIQFEKGQLMKVSASELYDLGHHIFRRLQEFPTDYFVAEKPIIST